VLLPVHMYGQPCNMTAIDQLGRQFGISVVEDFAQAHGASWLSKKTGSFGTVNATSFYPTKNLGAIGDGGAVTLFDGDKADFIRRYRNYGMDTRHCFTEIGLNSRLDEIQAAVLTIKLAELDRWNVERRMIAEHYLKLLEGIGDLILPLSDKEAYHVYHLFVIRSKYRDKLQEFLLNKGIETLIHYPTPPHLQKAYFSLGFKKGSFPVAEAIADTALSLPLWPGLAQDQIDYIAEEIANFFKGRFYL
jgi:dTDP-4-amino-4,6-dideoxygalactose transaminase